MATSKKSVTVAPTEEAKVVAPKPVKPAKPKVAKVAAPVAVAAAPAEEKPAVKVVAKKAVAKKVAAKKAPAKKPAVKSAGIDPTQRAHYIEVAAFYIAERRGFTPGNPEQDYLDAAAEIDRLIAAGHFGK